MFAKRLKEARAMRDVSQRALGAKIGMTKQAGSTRVNRYEQQTSRADMDTAAALAEALGVPLAYLFAHDRGMADWILAYDAFSQEQRDSILSLAASKPASDPTASD
ncbi:helix-turn-helix domain-containing protein [Stenotrophomonas sp. Ps199]|uniref:Helix-turn-helix domain-containing protein n=1 Tax=Stenotrophomonas riyadhensis TaxID=2859893 RepID=A0ABT2X9Y6_9GAMM|nr:helix-turn-helix domain-containing protein [Stenotrophomonas sp. CFS3442]